MDNAQILRQSMISDNQARIEELQAVIDRHNAVTSIVSHGWIVTMPGLGAIEFQLEKITEGKDKGRYRAVSFKHARVEKSARYTREDAKVLAADLRNGKDEQGTAIFWIDAVIEEQQNLIELNATLANL